MCRHVSVIFLYSVCTLRPTDVKLWNSSMLYHTACLQAYNLPWAMGEISFGYSLITGDLGLPAYNLPCSVSHLFSLITYHGTCTCLPSMAKCVVHFLNCSRFELVFRIHQTCCAFGQMLRVLPMSDALCIWPNVQIDQMHLTVSFLLDILRASGDSM